jgi:predicted RND superfamily exporter protein
MRIEELQARREARTHAVWKRVAGGSGITVAIGAGVILLVAVSQAVGAIVLAVATLLFIGLPLLVLGMSPVANAPLVDGAAASPATRLPPGRVGMLVGKLGSRPLLVLPVAVIVTALSVILALRLEATFDVKDFFSHDSDIVIGLDKLDEHVAERSGESAIVLVRGDLAEPTVMRALGDFIRSLADNPFVGKDANSKPSVFERNVEQIVRLATDNPLARMGILATTGVQIADEDGDGLPDSREQIAAVLGYTIDHGLPLDETTLIYTSDQVRTSFKYVADAPGESIAQFFVGIPGTREQSVISNARVALEADAVPLLATPGVVQVGLTGTPFVRDAELTATVDNLRRSLPLAAVGAFVLLLIAMRSVRYAVVTVIPIGLVVAWLYAIMELAGFALNFVSATIGAVSIGVGIDYSIHMTERFREEVARNGSRVDALARAADGAGVALLASAGSSVVGFAIMGFAPMPMFSTFGALTALMIFLALAAALVVLPPLLMVASAGTARSAAEAVAKE